MYQVFLSLMMSLYIHNISITLYTESHVNVNLIYVFVFRFACNRYTLAKVICPECKAADFVSYFFIVQSGIRSHSLQTLLCRSTG